MTQYKEIKEEYRDAILLFRLGDFYEMFFEDAKIASKELGLTLTSRNREKGQDVPLAGVPYHSVASYVAKLLEKGYRSEEHTSELQSRQYLVCRLLLEKKKYTH